MTSLHIASDDYKISVSGLNDEDVAEVLTLIGNGFAETGGMWLNELTSIEGEPRRPRVRWLSAARTSIVATFDGDEIPAGVPDTLGVGPVGGDLKTEGGQIW